MNFYESPTNMLPKNTNTFKPIIPAISLKGKKLWFVLDYTKFLETKTEEYTPPYKKQRNFGATLSRKAKRNYSADHIVNYFQKKHIRKNPSHKQK